MPSKVHSYTLIALLLLLAACSPFGNSPAGTSPTTVATRTPTHLDTTVNTAELCSGKSSQNRNFYTPHALRVAYGVEALTEQGFTGKGEAVIDIVSYGSPTLQQDMDVFDKQFGLPPVTIRVSSPLGTVPFNANNKDMIGWAAETELDVQIIHTIGPGAGIVVMTSPVDETEGTIGLPEFLKLEQNAVAHHLGFIFSQSYVASEATLADRTGQQLVKTYSDFYKQIITQEGFTVVSGSGDNGATDWGNIAATKLAPMPTVNFPADVPWVTAVGGTNLVRAASGYDETAWPGSGGGLSKFFSEPTFQKRMPQAVQSLLAGHPGLPDLAADAHPNNRMAFYFDWAWGQTRGTNRT